MCPPGQCVQRRKSVLGWLSPGHTFTLETPLVETDFPLIPCPLANSGSSFKMQRKKKKRQYKIFIGFGATETLMFWCWEYNIMQSLWKTVWKLLYIIKKQKPFIYCQTVFMCNSFPSMQCQQAHSTGQLPMRSQSITWLITQNLTDSSQGLQVPGGWPTAISAFSQVFCSLYTFWAALWPLIIIYNRVGCGL